MPCAPSTGLVVLALLSRGDLEVEIQEAVENFAAGGRGNGESGLAALVQGEAVAGVQFLPAAASLDRAIHFSIKGQVSAIIERFKEKPMSSDSIYRTGVADQMNHREDSPSALLSYVCCHGSFPRE